MKAPDWLRALLDRARGRPRRKPTTEDLAEMDWRLDRAQRELQDRGWLALAPLEEKEK